MRVVAWNIRTGGGRRIVELGNQLEAWRPDVIALSEFRGTKPSQQLASRLGEMGFTSQLSTADPERPATNALLLASRSPLRQLSPLRFVETPTRWLAASVVVTVPLVVGSMHVPNRVTGKKYTFHANVLSVAKAWQDAPGLLIGDTNSGLPGIDEESPAFNHQEAGWFEALLAQGWTDVFRHLHGDERVYSWYSPNGRNGFRLDQAFANAQLLPSVKNMRYEWGQSDKEDGRRDALSDHAAIILDFKPK